MPAAQVVRIAAGPGKTALMHVGSLAPFSSPPAPATVAAAPASAGAGNAPAAPNVNANVSSKRPVASKRPTVGGKSKAAASAAVKKKKRTTPGTAALRQIRKYQRSTVYYFKNVVFQRMLRHLAMKYTTSFNNQGIRFTPDAVNALKIALEEAILHGCEDINLFAIHAKRVTLLEKDLKLFRHVKDFAGVKHHEN
jgi:histone H3/H4